MVEIVDQNIAQLAANADDWAAISDVMIQAEGRDGRLAGELRVERESLYHANLYARLLECVDEDLVVDQGEGD